MLDDLLISMGVAALLAAIKNPAKKAQLRKVLLKVFKAIKAAFPGDPEFDNAV